MSEFNIGHLEIDSPFGNAGGVVKHVEDVEKMAHTGVGWIEAGSYTLEARAGNGPNGEVVYHHDLETGETFNSLGMPNKGMDVVKQEIPAMVEAAHAHGKPLVVNVAPVSNEPAVESLELVSRAYEAGADAVLLNAGCPNVIIKGGERHELLSHNPQQLERVLRSLRPVTEQFKPIFIRTSPIRTIEDLGVHRAYRVINQTIAYNGVVSAVFTPNTWPGHRPLDANGQPILEVPGEVGGKSGPAMAEDAVRETMVTAYFLESSDPAVDTVSSSGIVNGEELARRLQRPGVAAGAGTTFFYESGDWEHDVDKLLWEFQDARSKS